MSFCLCVAPCDVSIDCVYVCYKPLPLRYGKSYAFGAWLLLPFLFIILSYVYKCNRAFGGAMPF